VRRRVLWVEAAEEIARSMVDGWISLARWEIKEEKECVITLAES
jgi:hypothetical protein